MSAPPPYNITYNMAPQPSPSFNAPQQPVYVTAPSPQVVYAQPPPMQYQPQGPPPGSNPPPAIVGGVMGPMPMVTTCPSCRQQVQTNIVHSSGVCTWLLCLGCFCCTGICCWIPFIIDDTKDVTHMCSRCGSMIGKYSRL